MGPKENHGRRKIILANRADLMEIEEKYLPSNRFKQRALIFSVITIIIVISCALLGFNPLMLFTEFHHLINLFRDMTPPNFSFVFRKPMIILSLYETLAMAFLGTFLGGGAAFFLSLLAANNISPHPMLSGTIKMLFAAERVIPSFIILLFFLIFAGIGPFAGMLALAVSTIGTFGKLFAEAIEEVKPEVLDGVRATGAKKSQLIRYGILPEAAPSIISDLFYAFDVNTRRSIGLGIFGGGGLGLELLKAMGMMEYKSAIAIMLLIVALVFVIEHISNFLRRMIMGTEKLA